MHLSWFISPWNIDSFSPVTSDAICVEIFSLNAPDNLKNINNITLILVADKYVIFYPGINASKLLWKYQN